MDNHTDTIASTLGNAGWLDEDSDTQAVFLLQRLSPVLAALAVNVASIPPARMAAILAELESF